MAEIQNPLLAGDKDVRTLMQEALQKFNVKQVDVAREAGVHHSTLSLWLQGKVRGHQIRIQDTLSEWLHNLYNNKPRYTSLNKTSSATHHLKPQILTLKTPRHQVGQSQQRILERPQQLIPVHLDLQVEGKKLRESFLWNLHEPYLTPQVFARIMVQENPLISHYETHISDTIKKAISNFRPYKGQTVECIRVLELDVQVDNINLKDRIEWDINNPANNPQQFAWDMCQQLHLNADFCVKIAHQLREQILFFRKNLAEASMVKNQIGATHALKKKHTRNTEHAGLSLKDGLCEVNENNYIRGLGVQNIHGRAGGLTRKDRIQMEEEQLWEPVMEILHPNESKKIETTEGRKSRYSRRCR